MLAGELPFLAPTVPGILLKQITEGAPPLMRKRPDCPEDLAACVMRSLEKEPEARWPTADALRRALESRATPAYQPRRPSTAFAPARAFEGRAPARDLPARRSPELGPPARRPRRDVTPRGAPKTNEPKIVQDARNSFVKWASVCGPLLVLNVATGNHIPSWSLMIGGLWMAFGLVPKYVRLWHAGYSWRDRPRRTRSKRGSRPRAASARGICRPPRATSSARTWPTCSRRAATARRSSK
jgi:serine/threonine protein kinase